MKVLIIEDEIPAANRLKRILVSVDDNISILDICRSVKSSIEWLKSNPPPDVIFMDIELSDGRSFEIFKVINITSNVVFITAYDEFAIKAIKLNALDYLLKPIDKEELREAIQRIRKGQSSPSQISVDYSGLQQSLENGYNIDKWKRLIINDVTGSRFVDIGKVTRLKADSNYTNIYLNSGEVIMSSKTLKTYEEQLGAYGFFRVSNTYVVNLLYIEKYIKSGGITMVDGVEIEVSRQRRKELLNIMSLNGQ